MGSPVACRAAVGTGPGPGRGAVPDQERCEEEERRRRRLVCCAQDAQRERARRGLVPRREAMVRALRSFLGQHRTRQSRERAPALSQEAALPGELADDSTTLARRCRAAVVEQEHRHGHRPLVDAQGLSLLCAHEEGGAEAGAHAEASSAGTLPVARARSAATALDRAGDKAPDRRRSRVGQQRTDDAAMVAAMLRHSAVATGYPQPDATRSREQRPPAARRPCRLRQQRSTGERGHTGRPARRRCQDPDPLSKHPPRGRWSSGGPALPRALKRRYPQMML